MQLPYQLCVGNCLDSRIWRARSFLRPEQHWCPISNTSTLWLWWSKATQHLTHAYCPWCMLAGDKYVPVRCLYKPAPVAVLELIKSGCKTSCKGHCSCKKYDLPCTGLCKCHTSHCSNLPDYRMIADEDDVWRLQEDEQGWTIRRLCNTGITH